MRSYLADFKSDSAAVELAEILDAWQTKHSRGYYVLYQGANGGLHGIASRGQSDEATLRLLQAAIKNFDLAKSATLDDESPS